ncbi:shikimate dehydrogenase, partial [Flavobacteriales bacterium]|nr:shikimate dehydrogenase [Flavobacteriales bacterium]
DKMIGYKDTRKLIKETKLIINTTPVGQYPNLDKCPNIPYELISSQHCCIDLIYNPSITGFLKKCGNKGAQTIGGSIMFTEQAEASWNIWNKLIQGNV